ncbi:Flagellar hook-length control protein [Pandoraea soli]|uniref:Flagellar hook-length control protein n=1 Tax=Pandoraea soli TaxID=2508293 RepID=A0ABY6W612_9BURK|nr:Flagellar hook-length control protein [Pandoraea soli]
MADALAQAQGHRDTAAQAATATATQAAAQIAQTAAPALDAQPQLPVQANLPAALALNARVGTQDWNNQLSQQVVWLSSAHAQTAQLSLNPPDLGPLHVVLNVANDSAQAMFVSQHAAVRDAVQAALPQLRESLANNGIALGNATVSSDSSQQQAFAQQGANGNGNGNGSGNGNARGTPGFGQGDDAALATTVSVPVRVSNGLVDTFA